MAGGRTADRFESYTKMHEVWNKLEKALDQLKIKDGLGQVVDTYEAYNIVSFWNGPKTLVRLSFDWQNGVIQNQEFFEEAMMYVNRFADAHNLKRPEV